MITVQDVISIGFVYYTGGPVRGINSNGFYMNRVNNLGWSVGIDLEKKQCFYFEGDRPSAFPYPVPATIETFHYPENIQDLKNIFYSLTGNKA